MKKMLKKKGRKSFIEAVSPCFKIGKNAIINQLLS